MIRCSVKTLSMEMVRRATGQSDADSETQILHFDGAKWNPYTYRWETDQSDATLLDSAGASRVLEVVDNQAPDGMRHQTWRFSSRAECQRCHNRWSGPILGFNIEQLHLGDEVDCECLRSVEPIRVTPGYFRTQVPKKDRARIANPYDGSDDSATSVHSAYLQVNCAHCHRKHVGRFRAFDHAQRHSARENSNVGRATRCKAVSASQGRARDCTRRSLAVCPLLYRMSKTGGGRMPHIGSSEVDTARSWS